MPALQQYCTRSRKTSRVDIIIICAADHLRPNSEQMRSMVACPSSRHLHLAPGPMGLMGPMGPNGTHCTFPKSQAVRPSPTPLCQANLAVNATSPTIQLQPRSRLIKEVNRMYNRGVICPVNTHRTAPSHVAPLWCRPHRCGCTPCSEHHNFSVRR